jgi:hypothetical protein
VLLLPTDLYVVGGALVVGVSFLLIALVPAANLRALAAFGWRVGRPPGWLCSAASLASFVVLVALILVGLFGTQDPLANLLPLTVWTLGWIGLTFAHILFGDLWSVVNPWRGLHDVISRAVRPPRLPYPEWLGTWPAFVQFLAFAWFELISTVPRSPDILAQAVSLYFAVNLVCALLFGREVWLRYGEAFSVFYRFVAWLSPFRSESSRAVVSFPGLNLLQLPPLPVSGVAFVLLMLATVSFDGIGVNPLDFPGRSGVALANTFGLIAAFAVLAGLYGAAAGLGRMLSRGGGGSVVSIVPIALGYHAAHYLTVFLVDLQYTAIAFGDLLGLGHGHVTTSFLTNYDSVRLIWHFQVGVIVAVHVIAVSVGHFIAMRQCETRRAAILGQVPMTFLMIAYTLFGLWLLSAPAIG